MSPQIGIVLLHLLAGVITYFLVTTGESVKSGPLFLTPYINSGQLDLARNLSAVGRLPNVADGPVRPSISGLVTVDEGLDSHLFFWFFPAINRPETAPVLLWFEGGPGVSNFLTIFYINGPYIVTEALQIELRQSEFDWTRNYSIVYVDSPVGTGFSYTGAPGGYPSTSEENALHLLTFVRQFRQLFPEFTDPVATPWHLVGASYGGHIAPALATALAPEVELGGILLLVPWVHPRIQVGYYADYLHQLGLIPSGEFQRHFESAQQRIQALIDAGDLVLAHTLWSNLIVAQNSSFANASGFTTTHSILHDQIDMALFLYAVYASGADFKAAVHVGEDATFNFVSMEVRGAMEGAFMENKSRHVESSLQRGVNVTIVAGQLDIIVPHLGVEAMTEALQWDGAEEFKEAEREIWRAPAGAVAGYVRKVNNLQYVLMRNTGHGISDQQELGREMVNMVIPRLT